MDDTEYWCLYSVFDLDFGLLGPASKRSPTLFRPGGRDWGGSGLAALGISSLATSKFVQDGLRLTLLYSDNVLQTCDCCAISGLNLADRSEESESPPDVSSVMACSACKSDPQSLFAHPVLP